MPAYDLKASSIPYHPQLQLYLFPAINPCVEGRDSQAANFLIGDHRLVVGVERGWNLCKGEKGNGEEESMAVQNEELGLQGCIVAVLVTL